jgi:DNA (cytosine-5)-methyltransferase 1
MGPCSRDWRQGGESDRGRRAERIGSLFSGIGGLELALESLGMRTIWQVECDRYARRVLWQHWPIVPKYEDVCAVGAANLCPVDVICGGFPCQGISDAGLRLGLDDPRSGLWREFARVVRELRPRYVFVENVAALRVRGLGRVLGDLAEIGYDAEWDCVRAADVGALHLRNRLFILAYAQCDRPWPECGRSQAGPGPSVALDDGADRHLAHADGAGLEGRRRASVPEHADERTSGARRASVADAEREGKSQPEGSVGDERRRPGDGGKDVADAAGDGRDEGQPESAREQGRSDASVGGWWSVEPDVGRVAHGVPARVDRLRCLGNAVVPAQAAFAWRVLMARIIELSGGASL